MAMSVVAFAFAFQLASWEMVLVAFAGCLWSASWPTGGKNEEYEAEKIPCGVGYVRWGQQEERGVAAMVG